MDGNTDYYLTFAVIVAGFIAVTVMMQLLGRHEVD